MKKRGKRKSILPNAGDLLVNLEVFAEKMNVSPPHMHVSDPIPNEETLRRGFAGGYHIYSRFAGHPDNVVLEQWICDFEQAKHARVYGSGMAAITATLFAAGEMHGPVHVIALLPLYGGTYALLRKLARSPAHHFLVTFLYASDPNLQQKLYDAIGPATRALIFEATGNPTLTFPDIETVTHIAHRGGRDIITVCDNTFLCGLFKPLKWGVDVVVHSGTKYLAGESAWLMGYTAVSDQCLQKWPQFWNEVVEWSTELGAALGPFEAWSINNFCLPNLMERVCKQSSNALRIAEFLSAHPKVEKVIYPALTSSCSTSLKYLETSFYGGMIAFYLKNASLEHAMNFMYYLNNHSHIMHKASLGGPIDSVQSPFMLSHAAYDPTDSARCGITPNLIRFSAGRDDVQKTIGALDEALCMTIR